MLILAIETSTPQSSVCLATERGVVASATLARGQAHGEFLPPAIAFCLDHAGLRISDVNGVAAGLGPGLFTGMRVGIATAQTIAHARRLPVVGLTSLDLVAYAVRHVRRLVCSVLDARRGELFWAFYRSSPGGVQRVSELRVGPPGKLAGEIEASADTSSADVVPGATRVLAVGDGAIAQRALLESAGAEVGTWATAHPQAASLAELSLPRFLREETQRPEDLRPVYIRKADAKIGWRNRGALLGGSGEATAVAPNAAGSDATTSSPEA